MKKLWEYVDGEPFMVNSVPVFRNPRKRKSPKRTKAVMKYKKRSNPRRRHYRRRARNVPAVRAAAHNPRRRRHSYRRRSYRHNPMLNRRRRHRRNPPTIGGLQLIEILYCGGAVIVAPILENQIRPLLPASLQTGTAGRWALKVGAAALTWQGWRFIFGRKIGDLTGLVLGSNLLSDAVSEFAPSLTSGLGGYSTLPARGLGGYLNVPARRGLGPFVGGGRAALMPVRGPLDATY